MKYEKFLVIINANYNFRFIFIFYKLYIKIYLEILIICNNFRKFSIFEKLKLLKKDE